MLLAWLVVTVALRLRALGQGGWAVVIFAVGLVVWILVTAVVFWRLTAAADEAAHA